MKSKSNASKWWTGQPERYISNCRDRINLHKQGHKIHLTTLERSLLEAERRNFSRTHSSYQFFRIPS